MIRLKNLLKEQVSISPEQEAWLDKCTGGSKETKFGDRPTVGTRTWTADNQGYVTVQGDFNFTGQRLTDFKGVKFKEVTGNFYCAKNNLTSLEGSPQKVGKSFICSYNKLTSLKGAPQTVGRSFICHDNNLTNLEGAPQTVGYNFDCSGNNLTSLKGAPQKVPENFVFNFNDSLESLEGAPKFVGGNFFAPVQMGTKADIKQELDYQNIKVLGGLYGS